jgi:hypothetical protein
MRSTAAVVSLTILFAFGCEGGAAPQAAPTRDEIARETARRSAALGRVHYHEFIEQTNLARNAAGVFVRRHMKRGDAAENDGNLQFAIDQVCKAVRQAPLLLSDLDRYVGPDPELIACDEIRATGGSRFVYDRNGRTWKQR